MLTISKSVQEQMAQNLRDFISEHPDEPLFEEYPYPAKEFSVYVMPDSIAINHASLPPMFLSTT